MEKTGTQLKIVTSVGSGSPVEFERRDVCWSAKGLSRYWVVSPSSGHTSVHINWFHYCDKPLLHIQISGSKSECPFLSNGIFTRSSNYLYIQKKWIHPWSFFLNFNGRPYLHMQNNDYDIILNRYGSLNQNSTLCTMRRPSKSIEVNAIRFNVV